MSLLHKALATLDIGAATVDTKLEKADFVDLDVDYVEGIKQIDSKGRGLSNFL